MTADKKSIYLLMALGLFGILHFHFLTLFFSIAITYIIIESITNGLQKLKFFSLEDKGTTVVSLSLFALFCVAIWFIGLKMMDLFQPHQIGAVLNKIIEIINDLKTNELLPSSIVAQFPNDAHELKEFITSHVSGYLSDIQAIGKYSLAVMIYVILGVIIGIMLSFHNTKKNEHTKSKQTWASFFKERIATFKNVLKLILGAQIKIAIIDTILTAIYLVVILPFFDIDIPFKWTAVGIAFIVGLLPVVGNLISNTIIVILSLGVSFNVALASLLFLVIIHKFEYFLNAKIIGQQTQASAWEILLAILVMEHLFGIGGLVMAPFYYAYIKEELRLNGKI